MKNYIFYKASKKHFLLFFITFFGTQIVEAQLEPNVLWAKQFGGPEQDYAGDMAMDHFGNIYVTGFFRGTANFGDITLTAPGSSAPFVAKTDPSGNVLWAKQFGGTGLDIGYGITTDTYGNAYTTGIFTGTVSFGSITLSTSTAYPTAFVVKQDTDGNVLWAKKFADVNEQEIVYARAIAIDTQNNVYMRGDFYSTADFGGIVLTKENDTGFNAFIIKQNDSGDVLWAKKIGDTGSVTINKLASDTSNNIYITGYFIGNVNFDGVPNSSSVYGKGFLLKLNSSGDTVWAKYFGGENHIYSTGYDINIDNMENIYLVGRFEETFQMDAITFSSPYNEAFFLKLNSYGQPLWIKTFETTNKDKLYFHSITTNTSGDIYIAGEFLGLFYFNDTYLSSTGILSDCIIIKMDNSGTIKRADRFGSSLYSRIHSIEINTNEELYIFGNFMQTIDFGGITLTSNGNSADPFLAKFILEDMSIDKSQTSQLKIYPNPIKDFLAINISDKDANLSAEIINLLGQKVKTFQNISNTGTLDVSDLSTGIYLLNLINQNGEKQTIKIKKI